MINFIIGLALGLFIGSLITAVTILEQERENRDNKE